MRTNLFGAWLCLTGTSFASAAQPMDCRANIASELLQCVNQNAPQLQLVRAKAKREKVQKEIANQTPNLDVDSRLLYGTSDASVSSELTIAHTFELGGKQEARKELAIKKVDAFSLSGLIKQQEVLTEFWLKLNRVRQVEHELELLEETAQTYKQIRGRYLRQPRLSPEQQLGSDIFLFAAEENAEHIKQLKGERLLLFQSLRLLSGATNETLSAVLPKPLANWPTINKATTLTNSPLAKLETAKLSLSEAEQAYQESVKWPDLQIGPSVDLEGINRNMKPNVGVSFAFKFPLYHQNDGERKYAEQGVIIARKRKTLVLDSLKQKRKALLQVYQTATGSLDTRGRINTIEAKHKRLHRMIDRGLVHTSLVIELHRQQFDLIQKTHENEIQAIESLWGIYAIDGTMLKESK